MNEKLYNNVIEFFNYVSYYIDQEYPKYWKRFNKESTLNDTFNRVQSYYLGGNNASDTARFIVDEIQAERK